MMCDSRLFAPQVAAFKQGRDIIVLPLHGTESIAVLVQTMLAGLPERFALAAFLRAVSSPWK